MKYNTKAIVTVPAWAEALHNGTAGQADTINTAAMAYAYVPLVFRATRLVCNALVGAPVRFYNKSGDEVDWPFPDISLRRLLWNSQAALSLVGANYIEKIPRIRSGKVGALRWVNPTTMKVRLVKGDDKTQRLEFQQGDNGSKWTLDDMMYMREFSLRDDVGPGDSSAKVSLNDAALLRYMSRFAARFFETGAMPITVLQIDGIVDPDEAKRIEGFFKRAATRIRNAFNVLALGRAIEPKIISQPLKDLVMPELNDQARRAVADAFDFHPSLLDEAPNMATATEHRLSLYEDSVKPRAMVLEEDFNQQLLKPMEIEMRFAFEEMDIFQADENDKAASVETLTRAISTDPEVAEFVMNTVLGYDLDEEQQKKFDELIAQKKADKQSPAPEQPAANTETVADATDTPAKSAWSDDIQRWERKALRVLKESGSAVCQFESENIPADIRRNIEAGMADCKTADAVRSLFGAKQTLTPAPEYKSNPETMALAASINSLAEAYLKSQTQTIPPPPPPQEPVIVINNSQKAKKPAPIAQVFAKRAFEKKGE